LGRTWLDGLVQNYCNSFTIVKELQEFCTKPPNCAALVMIELCLVIISSFLIWVLLESQQVLIHHHYIVAVEGKVSSILASNISSNVCSNSGQLLDLIWFKHILFQVFTSKKLTRTSIKGIKRKTGRLKAFLSLT